MIKDLLRIKDEIDCLIETYKDLHPNDDIHYDISSSDECIIQETLEKETALKRIKEGYYENKFSESKGKKTSGSSEGQSSLCVYGDT